MNYIKITKTDIANGEGVRCVLWVAGCDVRCEGCHNPESWDFCAGQPFDESAMQELLQALSKPWIKGLTLSGGHPLAYSNLPCVQAICETVRSVLPDKDIWLYTGYSLTKEDFAPTERSWIGHNLRRSVLSMCDVVVDGPYDNSLRDISLRFRGSSNPRIIDVRRTAIDGEIRLWQK